MNDYEVLLNNHNILTEVKKLIQQNEVISAIKLVKDKTGLGLKESKEIVDSISILPFKISENFDNGTDFFSDEISQKNNTEEQLNLLLQQNKKLEAIKLLRDTTGMSLSDAKNFVEKNHNTETAFIPENIGQFSNTSVKMTNINGKIKVKIKEGNNPEKIIYPNDPDWGKAKNMLGNKKELQNYETEFFEGKHPISQKKSNLFIESNSYTKWIFFLVLFCVIMLVIYFYYPKN